MRETILRPVLVSIGTVALVLGVIGIFVPLLPTTPFLLLASACYLRGSKRMHEWLLSHGTLGAYIRAYEEGRGIPLRAKVLALAMMWPSIAYAAYLVGSIWIALAFFVVASAVTLHLLRLPTLKR